MYRKKIIGEQWNWEGDFHIFLYMLCIVWIPSKKNVSVFCRKMEGRVPCGTEAADKATFSFRHPQEGWGKNAFDRSYIFVMKLVKCRQNLIVLISSFQLVKQHKLVGNLENTKKYKNENHQLSHPQEIASVDTWSTFYQS